MDMTKKGAPHRVLLLDTSAFIQGYGATDTDSEHFSVPAVRAELREGSLHRLRFDNAARNGYLKILTPSPWSLERLDEVVKEMGEKGILSNADTQLLALGLLLQSEGMSPTVVSDDYAVQNVANSLGLGFRSLATPGIKQRFEWIIYCPGCRRSYESPQRDNVCPVCGTKLKRKPGVKKKIK
jgi:UPF0271 protein